MKNERSTLECRNCGSLGAFVLYQGSFAPFFLKRVYDIELTTLGDRIHSSGKILKFGFISISKTTKGRALGNFKSQTKTHIRVCNSCGFIGPHSSYSDSQLINLYADYRSNSYNNERISFEPEYSYIKDLVGKSETEVSNRLANVGGLIKANVDLNTITKVLDWGGGEGKFVPLELRDKEVFILDVSSEPLSDERFVPISQPKVGEKFDFVQICHVLEHVSSPRDFLKTAISHLNSGGFLYIEVPQDRSNEDMQGFLNRNPNVTHVIHEHLNLFTAESIKALGTSLGLKDVIVETRQIDCDWIKPQIVSGLFKKE